MGSIHLIKSAFLSLKIIVGTLTDVGNAKHQNITSVNRHITLLSDANVPVGFRAQINFGFTVSFHSTRSDARDKFDSGVIFLDQSPSFATHSNQ